MTNYTKNHEFEDMDGLHDDFGIKSCKCGLPEDNPIHMITDYRKPHEFEWDIGRTKQYILGYDHTPKRYCFCGLTDDSPIHDSKFITPKPDEIEKIVKESVKKYKKTYQMLGSTPKPKPSGEKSKDVPKDGEWEKNLAEFCEFAEINHGVELALCSFMADALSQARLEGMREALEEIKDNFMFKDEKGDKVPAAYACGWNDAIYEFRTFKRLLLAKLKKGSK